MNPIWDKEKIQQLREWCDLTHGLDAGDFAGLLEEALDEIERLQKILNSSPRPHPLYWDNDGKIGHNIGC